MARCRPQSSGTEVRSWLGTVVGLCVGIDLAGVEHRPLGVAILHGRRLVVLERALGDEEVLGWVGAVGPRGKLAINGSLTRPCGRCCLDDDCRCRVDPGMRNRSSERELVRRGPILATNLVKVPARRDERIADLLWGRGQSPLEVYPHATLRMLGLPCAGKQTVAGRWRI